MQVSITLIATGFGSGALEDSSVGQYVDAQPRAAASAATSAPDRTMSS